MQRKRCHRLSSIKFVIAAIIIVFIIIAIIIDIIAIVYLLL